MLLLIINVYTCTSTIVPRIKVCCMVLNILGVVCNSSNSFTTSIRACAVITLRNWSTLEGLFKTRISICRASSSPLLELVKEIIVEGVWRSLIVLLIYDWRRWRIWWERSCTTTASRTGTIITLRKWSFFEGLKKIWVGISFWWTFFKTAKKGEN